MRRSAVPILLFVMVAITHGWGSAIAAPPAPARDSLKFTRHSEEIRRMYSESYRLRSESQDPISQSFSEYVRGVDTYKNPYEGRPVQLPSGYNDAWVNSRGEYLLSNDAGFNTNAGDTTEWRRMDRRDGRGQ